MKRILILHGPNLNLLGEREPKIYGHLTLRQINSEIKKFCSKNGLYPRLFQSNGEGELIDAIHKNRKWAHGIVINAGAYTHYSYAIRDALASVNLPAVEVHLTDLKRREKFRRQSVIKAACIAQISGLGWHSYTEGIKLLMSLGS